MSATKIKTPQQRLARGREKRDSMEKILKQKRRTVLDESKHTRSHINTCAFFSPAKIKTSQQRLAKERGESDSMEKVLKEERRTVLDESKLAAMQGVCVCVCLCVCVCVRVCVCVCVSV